MGRFRLVILLACSLLLLATPGLALSTLDQKETSDANAHPVIGTWLTQSANDPEEPPSVTSFQPGGGIIDIAPDGTTGLGTWTATGPANADASIWILDDGGSAIIRISIEVSADGQTFSGTFTFEVFTQDGEATGQYGPGEVTAERLNAEGPGEPVGTLDDLFAEEETPAVPAAVNVVTLELTDLQIASDHLTLTAGVEYTFVVTNDGALVHEVIIEPAGEVDEPLEGDVGTSQIEDIQPGETEQLTWTFDEPGTYQFACHVPGHYEAGKVLEFEVRRAVGEHPV